ncbi:MAG: hypothetical protein PHE17_05295 [Thiothrix sp.]|uniref:hypothetical protein n=1 Tax=Thiothrix sp. TaxID=1032 RepID=UPI002614C550|nr:hypothetical protein [Thiothrix sp.]MDD5392417.1 hypothetical protein [Thiothrix sp.]
MKISDAQIDAIFGDSPFIAQRTSDKRRHEVVFRQNDDWYDVITNDEPEHCGFFESYADAEKVRRRLHTRWVLSTYIPQNDGEKP